jgi:hypothetical protein
MDLANYITHENGCFYFDPEEGTNNTPPLAIPFEDTDIIQWSWENKKFRGKLKSIGSNLFKIVEVTERK